MADFKKAQHHHGKAGAALKAGDHKQAAHHFGHALSALRLNGAAAMGAKPKGLRARLRMGKKPPPDPDTSTPGLETSSPGRSVALSLRGRLSRLNR